jgi:hypothetical protein
MQYTVFLNTCLLLKFTNAKAYPIFYDQCIKKCFCTLFHDKMTKGLGVERGGRCKGSFYYIGGLLLTNSFPPPSNYPLFMGL